MHLSIAFTFSDENTVRGSTKNSVRSCNCSGAGPIVIRRVLEISSYDIYPHNDLRTVALAITDLILMPGPALPTPSRDNPSHLTSLPACA